MVIDKRGATAYYEGENCLGTHGCAQALHCIAGGNLLADASVPEATIAGFVAADPQQHLGERLLLALENGLGAGGEANPVRSAHLMVADELDWPVIDLRVDMHAQPITELRRLWQTFIPEASGFVSRARNPQDAPLHGSGSK
jgi:uncharacterized Ntn-hydrolase superfamily protein